MRFLVIHGMLNAGAEDQEIIVEYTREIEDGYFKGLTPASGLEVLVVGDDAYRFQEDPSRPGVYRATFSPQPGMRYSLQVRDPAGDVVSAETLVPAAPHLISPGVDTTISLGNYVTFTWSSALAAAAYVVVDPVAGQPGSWVQVTLPQILVDTSYATQPGKLGGLAFDYRIAAVDSNYVYYMRRQTRLQSTVTGGFGLFGSYALSEMRTVSIR